MLNALTTARAPTAVMPLQNAARQLQQQLHRAPLRTPSTASALLARHGFLARSGCTTKRRFCSAAQQSAAYGEPSSVPTDSDSSPSANKGRGQPRRLTTEQKIQRFGWTILAARVAWTVQVLAMLVVTYIPMHFCGLFGRLLWLCYAMYLVVGAWVF